MSGAWPSRPWWRWGTATRWSEALSDRAAALTTGPGTDPGSDMGPLITAAHRDRVAGYVGSAESEGAEVVVDGREVKVPGDDDGFFVGPTLVDHVTPVHAGLPRRDLRARCSRCSGWTTWTRPSSWSTPTPTATGRRSSPGTGMPHAGSAATYRWGWSGINVAIPVPMAYYSFGGWKQSLFGDAHVHGMEGVRFNTRLKSVTTRWPEAAPPAPSGRPVGSHRSALPFGRRPLTAKRRAAPRIKGRAVQRGGAWLAPTGLGARRREAGGREGSGMHIENGGVDLHVEVTGEGRPVVLLHGFPATGRLWRHQVGPLASAGFQVIVPDLRGYGASGKPTEVEAYSLVLLATDMFAVLDHLEVDKARCGRPRLGCGALLGPGSHGSRAGRHLVALSVGHPLSFRSIGLVPNSRGPGTSCSCRIPRGVAERWLLGRLGADARE